MLNSFAAVFLTCKMELVIIPTAYGTVRTDDEMMYVKCFAKPTEVFNK